MISASCFTYCIGSSLRSSSFCLLVLRPSLLTRRLLRLFLLALRRRGEEEGEGERRPGTPRFDDVAADVINVLEASSIAPRSEQLFGHPLFFIFRVHKTADLVCFDGLTEGECGHV